MAEQTFLEENGVQVTNARFVTPGQTYAMSGVTAVKSIQKNPSRVGPIVLIVIGVLMLFGGQDVLMGALVFLAAGIIWWISKKPEYIVLLSSASGETQALNSKDKAFIDKVVKALNEAIIARG